MNPRTQLGIEAARRARCPRRQLVPDLDVRPVATGLIAPTSMAFLGANDFLALEKISRQGAATFDRRRTTGAVL